MLTNDNLALNLSIIIESDTLNIAFFGQNGNNVLGKSFKYSKLRTRPQPSSFHNHA